MKRDELVVGSLLFLLGALTAILSLNMKLGTFNAIGTGFFPLSLGILLMVLSSIYLAQIVLQLRNATPTEKAPGLTEVASATVKENTSIFSRIGQPTVNVLVVVGSMVFFALFLDAWGYLLCTFLMLLVLVRVLGMRNWIVVLTIAIIAAAGSWLIFVKLLKIPLPQGFFGL